MGAGGNTSLPEHQAIELAGPADTRLFFSGPPRAVTGKIPLVNSGIEKQRIEAIAVSAPDDLKGPTGLPLREFPFYTKLHPGEHINPSGRIMLDPQTKPGSYDIEITVGATTVPATVHVAEVVDLRIHPHEITLLVGSRSSYTRKITFVNDGNVALSLGARCEAPLFYSTDLFASALTGINKTDKKTVESMIRGALVELSEVQAGTLVMNREPITLSPGQKASLDVEFELPPDLKPLRHCHVIVGLYNARMEIDIYTTAKAGSGRGRKAQ